MSTLFCLADGSVLGHIPKDIHHPSTKVKWTDEEGNREDRFIHLVTDDEGVALFCWSESLQS